MRKPGKRRIVDAHVHLYDHDRNRYDFLEEVDPTFQALVGDYASLPRRYLIEDYLEETADYTIDGIIWHEFLSSDPLGEVLWAHRMAKSLSVPISIVGLVDFLAPDLDARLDAYDECENVTAVREHLGWDPDDPHRRFAKRSDLLSDSHWRRGLGTLRKHNFKCSLEVFSPQLPDLLTVVRLHPSIGFTVAVMGWPIAVDRPGFERWRSDLAALSTCDNIQIIISAIECVFGMKWSRPSLRSSGRNV
jgi:predicted TIM-barrel fold metal-dependent hydrolase